MTDAMLKTATYNHCLNTMPEVDDYAFVNERCQNCIENVVYPRLFKTKEFDAIRELITVQKIQKVIATLVCFKLKQDKPGADNESAFVAGIISSSLRMVPGV